MHQADSQNDRNGIPRVSGGRNSPCALRSLSTKRDVDLARWQESNDGTACIARLEFAYGERVKTDSQGYLQRASSELYGAMSVIRAMTSF